MLKLFALISLSFVLSEGGFPYVMCPFPSSILRPDGLFYYVDCDGDCKAYHGAEWGSCDEASYNCYCGPMVKSSGLYGVDIYTSFLSQEFRNTACDTTCKCLHGTVGGVTHVDKHICECGANTTVSACPFATAELYLAWVVTALQIPGLPIIG